MKKSVILACVVVSFQIFLITPTFGEPIPRIRFPLVCDLTNDGFFSDAEGFAQVQSNGDVRIKVLGLDANEEYECQLLCRSLGASKSAPCETNDRGKLHVVLPEFAANPRVCVRMTVEIIRDVAGLLQRCFVGYDQRDIP